MARQSQDVVVRFIGDTGNLGKGMDGLQTRFRAVTSSLEGIAKVGAAVGALSFFKTAIDEAREAARVTRQTEQVIRTTGAAANVTADHVAELSGRLSELAGVDDEVIQHGANLLLTFCLEEGAQALSRERGWVSHDGLRAGDEILSFDPADGTIRWEPVDSMHRFQVNGDMVRWRSKQIDVLSTPHHKWWTVGTSGRSPFTAKFMTTEQISGRQFYVQIGGGDPQCFAPERVYSDELVELAGWVITEGWVDWSRPSTAERNSACFSQSETANPDKVKSIRELVARLRMQGHRIIERSDVAKYNNSTMVTWRLSRDLGATLRGMLPSKGLSMRLLQSLTREQGSLLLDTLIAGDGHTDQRGHRQYIQKDRGQLDVLAALCAMLGVRTTNIPSRDGTPAGSLYLCDTTRLSGKSVNARQEHYEGIVWCPSLRTGIFLARANGRTFWTGNTKVRNEMGAGNDVFDQATQLTLDMSAAMSEAGDAGAGLQETAIRIGKALNDPVKGMTALSKVGVSFTAEQKEQVKALVASGDILGAQKIVLAELKTEFGGMAEATADSTAKAQVSFANFAEEIGTRLLPAVEAVSSWAVNSGIPAMTKFANIAIDVVTPAVKFLVAAGQEAVKFFADLPGPIQAGVVALAAWKLVGDNVTGVFTRLRAPVRGFGEDVRTVMSASQGEVGRFGASMQVLQDRVPTIGAMGAAFRNARGDTDGFGASLRGVAMGGLAGLRGAASGVMSLLGGPWGIAIAAATVGLGMFIQKNQQAKQRQQELRDAGREVAEAIKEQNGALNQNTRLAAANAAESKGLLKVAKELGIDGREVVDAIEKQGAAYDNLMAKLKPKIQADTEQKGTMDALQSSAFQLAGGLTEIVKGEDEHFAAQNRVNKASQEGAEGQKGLKAAQDENATSTDMLQDAVEGLGGKFDETKTEGQFLVDVIKGLTDAQITAIDLQENYEAALDGLTESIKNNKATLDIHTEAGRSNRDALENAATAIRDMTLADIEAGVPASEAIRKHDQRVAALQAEANKLGLAKSQTEELIGAYSRIPQNVRTIIETQNAEATYAKLLDMNLAQQALAQGISIRAAKGLFGNEAHGGRATGGPIFGPGGPKSDVIPIWASNGEYMHQASAVDYYGVGVMEAMNQRQIPRDVFRPGFQAGGLVSWPMWVQTAMTKIPAFGAAIPAGAAGAGVARWAPLVLQALAMLGQSSSLLPNVLRRMNQESGGNPSAINNWDVNAQRGDPSRGLMQTIGSTFNAYAGPYRSRGIYDPFANIYAGLNYAVHRYGSLQYAMDKPGGYRNGGWLKPGQLAYNETRRPEAVFNEKQLAELGGSHYHFHNQGVIGSQRELEDWFVKTADKVRSKGRL